MTVLNVVLLAPACGARYASSTKSQLEELMASLETWIAQSVLKNTNDTSFEAFQSITDSTKQPIEPHLEKSADIEYARESPENRDRPASNRSIHEELDNHNESRTISSGVSAAVLAAHTHFDDERSAITSGDPISRELAQ